MIRTLLLASALTLAACQQPAPVSPPGAEPGAASTNRPRPRVIVRPPLVPAGQARSVSADAQAELQWAASVVKMQTVSGGAAKLFGVAGGDPAMNGLQTYIAFFQGPAEGWRVYPVGDVLDFTVLKELPGRVDLQLSESVMDPSTQAITSRDRRVIVAWTGQAGAAPSAVTITPAR